MKEKNKFTKLTGPDSKKKARIQRQNIFQEVDKDFLSGNFEITSIHLEKLILIFTVYRKVHSKSISG